MCGARMNEKNFKGVDLNLLIIFAVVMRERSATRASECLCLSQSAVSHSIRRLRTTFADALFVRTGNGVQPTPRAETLYRDLGPLLDAIEGKLQKRAQFDATQWERVFKLALPGAIDMCVMPVLLRRLRREAPGVDLVLRPANRLTISSQLDHEEIDLAISHFAYIENRHCHRSLGKYRYSCLFDGRRIGIQSPISLESFLRLPHISISCSGDRPSIVDEMLSARELRRRNLTTCADASSIPFCLLLTDVIATLPECAAQVLAKQFSLIHSPIPVQVPKFPLSMIWHARHESDHEHAWFREVIAECITQAMRVSHDEFN